MPKMKSHSASKKRFRKNAAGKVKRPKAYKQHHAWAKTRKRVRQLGEVSYFEGSNAAVIKRLLPY